MNVRRRSNLYTYVATVLLYAVAAGSLLLLWLSPHTAARLGVEDGPVENVSALLLLIASMAMAKHGLAQMSAKKANLQLAALALSIAVAFFIFAGEEISWGQRIMGVQTGEFMQQYNWQGEMNLHNLHTDISNIGYHYGAFVFLIVLPLFRRQTLTALKKLRLGVFSQFIAPAWLALASFALLGMLDPRFVYVIEKPWAAALYLFSLGAGLALLLWQLKTALHRNDMRSVRLLVLSFTLITAGLTVSYFQSTDQMPNTISEYKELVIAAALCVFAVRWRAP